MKKVLLFVMIAAFLSTTSVMASEVRDSKPISAKALTNQISDFMSDLMVPDEIRGLKAEVRLAVDNKGTVRVLSVTTESDLLATYIKEKINFQEVRAGSYEEGIVYRVPIEVAE